MPLNTARPASTGASPAATKPGLKPPEVRRPTGAALASRTTSISTTATSKAAEAPSSTVGSQGSGGTGAGTSSGGGAKPPFDWDDIGLGSLVLARGDDEDAYYAAKVVATKADDHFVLTWADYPGYPEFSRPRRALGLLHPATPTRGR